MWLDWAVVKQVFHNFLFIFLLIGWIVFGIEAEEKKHLFLHFFFVGFGLEREINFWEVLVQNWHGFELLPHIIGMWKNIKWNLISAQNSILSLIFVLDRLKSFVYYVRSLHVSHLLYDSSELFGDFVLLRLLDQFTMNHGWKKSKRWTMRVSGYHCRSLSNLPKWKSKLWIYKILVSPLLLSNKFGSIKLKQFTINLFVTFVLKRNSHRK